MPHLLVAISAHGYGHTVQIAPVLNRLHARFPGMRLTLRTTVSPEFLASRISAPFTQQPVADDFGMLQHSALRIDRAASLAAYRQRHANWDHEVARVAAELEAAGADLLLADVPYLSIAGAARAGIPAVALCCLNWADIFAHYCIDEPGARAIHAQMLSAYNQAEVFLRTAPSMPMPGLNNYRDVGPLVERGQDRRRWIAEQAGLGADEKLVLVAMGGIRMRPPMEQWPRMAGVRWLVQADWQVQRDDIIVPEALGLSFRDAIASCDVLLTKPGYGSFTEAVSHGVPLLYVTREDWPEEPYLVEWVERHGHCRRLEPHSMDSGDFEDTLREMLSIGRYPVSVASGVESVVDYLSRWLS